MIRKARKEDIGAVAALYDAIHTEEEAGRLTIGWGRDIYPTAETAADAFRAGSLYVLEEQGSVLAAAKIDQIQLPAYADAAWKYEAADREVLVLHTLAVLPSAMSRGYGPDFMRFYENLARETGFRVLRIDTNARNLYARKFYSRLGYREAGIVPCEFNGLKDVHLVCLEKMVPGSADETEEKEKS